MEQEEHKRSWREQASRLKVQAYDLSIERGRHVIAANEIQNRLNELAKQIAELELGHERTDTPTDL